MTSPLTIFALSLIKQNRFHVATALHSYKSQRMLKHAKNISDTLTCTSRVLCVECVTCFVEFMNHKGCRVKKTEKHVLGVFE